ncbi:vgr related protein [Sphingorhabdus sp. SMR4y]|uniref:vgr related protein n=1 Tax=Sphingorhabdus sp. SMR4y TaxID=2584094 RepID=UPI000B5C2DF8|nr:vgr related protein [Sphingorhabdus sp. SMR4y]ASK86964.1 vgr related protein [Sphingorhabdus sp. SMR4y]
MTGRALTRSEIDLCRSVFGHAIDYENVTVFNRKWWIFQPRNVTMAPDGNLWFHPESDLFCDDFCGSSRNIQALFIHEMVHVWQHQQGVFLPLARHPFCRYDYELQPGKPFADYGIEQQAEIVSHHFLLENGALLKNGYRMADFQELLPFFR